MTLAAVNGQPIERLFERIRAELRGSSSERALKSLMLRAVLRAGFLGSERRLSLVDFQGKPIEVTATRRGLPEEPRAKVARRLPSGFGYLKWSAWRADVAEWFQTEMARLAAVPGLVIDVRGNGGGVREAVLDVASLLLPLGTSCGANTNRRGEREEYATHEVPKRYSMPVAILVDVDSASASELFAAVMQEHGRAVIVGAQTCGCALNQNVRRMQGGGTLRWSYRQYSSPRGRVIEGPGVTPDHVVPLTIQDLRDGRDAALEAAERILKARRP